MRQGESISSKVIDCAIEVSRRLGTGFLESVYENALCVELKKHAVSFRQQKSLKVIYKGEVVGRFVTDIAIENKLLIELKVASKIDSAHKAQVINYLKATGIPVALILNFGTPKMGVQRIVHQYNETEVI